MEILICNHCGVLVEGTGIQHRRRLFCGDECCEKFENVIRDHVGPGPVDLEKADGLEDDGLFEEEYVGEGEVGEDLADDEI
ncbi:hypothetical protein DRQ50_14465 [bacterium]|nr:MAG: hypothetical protein DRQ50_14465 [bacterium]